MPKNDYTTKRTYNIDGYIDPVKNVIYSIFVMSFEDLMFDVKKVLHKTARVERLQDKRRAKIFLYSDEAKRVAECIDLDLGFVLRQFEKMRKKNK